MTDWKTLCRQLVTAIESNCKEHIINHDLNCAYMKADAALAQPEPEGPTAWMYLGEPDYDGRDWHDHWHVTLDEKLARYASGNKDPVPLWRTPAINPTPQDS